MWLNIRESGGTKNECVRAVLGMHSSTGETNPTALIWLGILESGWSLARLSLLPYPTYRIFGMVTCKLSWEDSILHDLGEFGLHYFFPSLDHLSG